MELIKIKCEGEKTMIRTTLNWTVKNLKTMCDEKDTLSFNHPIQRQSSQWDNEQQSLLKKIPTPVTEYFQELMVKNKRGELPKSK